MAVERKLGGKTRIEGPKVTETPSQQKLGEIPLVPAETIIPKRKNQFNPDDCLWTVDGTPPGLWEVINGVLVRRR